MSTQRVAEEAEEALQALANLSDASDKAERDIRAEREQHVANLAKIVRGARVATQAVNDNIVALDHELGQVGNPASPSSATDLSSLALPSDDAPTALTSPSASSVVDPPTAEVPVVHGPPQPPRHGLDVRDWTAVHWVLALLGLAVGLIVARYTYHPLWGGLHGFGRGLVITLWWLGLSLSGFGSGGLLGHWWHNRNN